MRLIDADVLKQHIDKLPALPDGNFAGNHSALKALINMQPTIQLEERTEKRTETHACDLISRQAAIDAALEFFVEFLGGAFHEDDQKILMKRMNELPSTQPEERTEKRTETHACDSISRQAEIDVLDEKMERYKKNYLEV